MKYNQQMPPKFFHRFFRWYCRPALFDRIEGDLLEEYGYRVKKIGSWRADLKFILDVMMLFRPAIIKSWNYQNTNALAMYRNYLKTGWRNLAKNKTFSVINISGLSFGLTCSLLIALWVRDEYSVNAFHQDIDRIFAVTSVGYSGDEVAGSYDTPGLLADELKKVLPEIEYSSGYSSSKEYTFAVGENKIKFTGNFAGADFFKIFSYPLLLGTPESALKTPESIAISKQMATNLFGSPEQAIDKSVRFENYRDLKVTAVFDDMSNVSEKFEYIINWDFYLERNKWLTRWGNSGPAVFVKLREHAQAEAIQPKIQHFIKNYDQDYTDMNRLELGLQPFSEKYLHGNFENGHISGGRIEYVRLFQWVAVFILLIACINFMNLSTARALKRAREIGVRKVNGAVRTALVTQFMLEALIFTVVATLFSLLLLQLLLPTFNLLTEKNIVSPIRDITFWIGIILLMFTTAIIAGSYPALLLSAFKPISILKNNLKTSSSSIFFRKGLVVLQFSLSMIFIVGMIVVTRQVDYIHNKNLGYKTENLLYVPITGGIASNFGGFKNEATQIPGVINVSQMDSRSVMLDNTTGSVEWEGKDPGTRPIFSHAAVGYDFIKTMEAKLVQGRDFSEDFADTASYVINETAMKIMGYKNPIGMPLTFWDKKGTIVGVVKDFHIASLHVSIDPLVLRLADGNWGFALVRIESGKTAETLAALETIHKKLNPDFPFSYQFVDEEYSRLYKSEKVVKQLSTYFAFLAIFIASLGLLGLVVYSGEQRIKEVGIRKALGANLSQIVMLLSGDFLKLVVVSVVVASPIAYYLVNVWLKGFEYRIDIHWSMFVVAACSAVVIALLTISFQAVRSAMANPVESLRSE